MIVAAALNERRPDENMLKRVLARALLLAPADARFFSLAGIVEERAGRRGRAAFAFDRALELLPAEIQALAHKLRFAVEAGDRVAAAAYLEIIARRWEKHWRSVEPVLPALLADRKAFASIADGFSRADRLRARLIASLARNGETLSFAYSLLLEWHMRGISPLDRDINLVTTRLLEEKRGAEAFMLFRLTRAGGAHTGYVNNDRFMDEPSGNPFDWQLQRQAGVEFRFLGQSDGPETGAAKEPSPRRLPQQHGLAVGFFNNPVRLSNLRQTIRLAPGHYRLIVRYSAKGLQTPRPLQFAAACLDGDRILGAVRLDAGTFAPTRRESDFNVPPADCELQHLYLFNDNATESWRERYSGTLFLHRVTIEHARN